MLLNIKKNVNFQYYNFLLIFLLIYSIFFSYMYFGLSVFIFFLLFGFDTKISDNERIIYQLLVVVFYFKKFILGFWTNNPALWQSTFYENYNPYFPDFILVLEQINCNNADTECLSVGGYGPLTYFISIPINIDIVVSIYVILFLLAISYFVFYIFSRYQQHSHLISVLLLSPTINLLIHQMNIDLFFLLIALYCIYKPEVNSIIKSLLILIIALLKLHPAGLFVGLIIYSFLNKKKKLLYINLINLAVFLILLTLFLFQQNALLSSPRPSGLHNSIGLLSISQYIWINFLSFTGQYRDVLIIYFLTSLFLLFIFYLIRKQNYFEEVKINNVEFILIIWLGINYLYANYDYRNVLLVPIFFFCLSASRKKEYILILLILILSPLNTALSLYVLNFLILMKLLVFFLFLMHLVNNFIMYLKSKSPSY